MTSAAIETKALAGKTVAIVETRREDALAQMFEAKGAAVEHCPLVVIVDAPEGAPIVGWLREFCAGKFDDLILLTGEGLIRLHGFAQREGLAEPFRAALAKVRTIVRGPKPARALATFDLKPSVSAAAPTTAGVIETLSKEDLKGRRVAVQLYDDNPNEKLVSFLNGAGAKVSTVAPYRYAPQSDDARIAALIEKMAEGKIDIAPFTSAPQIRALKASAERQGLEQELADGMNRTLVAAIGPVVKAELERLGYPVHMTLEKNFFMGPLVSALAERAAKQSGA